ncbi:MAG: SDR family NAD(P)-dependent oxidoreductase [Candidatus Binatia bacterium]
MGILDGRVALVTGSGRGIGRAIALEMAREGADVALTSRTVAELERVAGEIRECGRRAHPVRCDLMDREDIKRMVATMIAHFGRLDVVVNNVGGVLGEIPKLLPLEHDDRLFEDNLFLNLTSAYYVTRYALPQMAKQRYGRVIFIGSGYAKNGGGLIGYTAAKHGLVGMTRAMSYQVAHLGITVNTLCPGWTNTVLVDFDVLAGVYGTTPEGAKALIEAENVQRRILEPEELGPTAALIASERGGGGITGQVISVDGGFRV